MKHLFSLAILCALAFLTSIKSHAQANLPYTLTFTGNDASRWADGIAEDGDGGTSKINGMNIQIYTAGTNHISLYPGSTIFWNNNSYYYSGNSLYHGITSGPDVVATNNGVPAMVIKSKDGTNFSLKGIRLYDWGYDNPITIETYDNGAKLGSVVFVPDAAWMPVDLSQSGLLQPSLFDNIDEVRFFPGVGQVFNLSMNNISLDKPAAVAPVTFKLVHARPKDNAIQIAWNVENESSIQTYKVERSLDGQSFTSIASVSPVNNKSGSASYEFIDRQIFYGNNFYRIKSVGFDGQVAYSTIVKVSVDEKSGSLSIFPNPAPAGVVNITMVDLPAGLYSVKVISNSGQTLITKMIQHQAGKSLETLNFSILPKGFYTIEITHPNLSTTKASVIY